MKYGTSGRPISRHGRSDGRESLRASFGKTDAAIENDTDPTRMIVDGAARVVGRGHQGEGLAGHGVAVANWGQIRISSFCLTDYPIHAAMFATAAALEG